MQNIQTTLPETGLVRLPAILALIPVSRSTWWKGVKSGKFPQPVKIGPRLSAWRVEDIRQLLASFQSTAPIEDVSSTRQLSAISES